MRIKLAFAATIAATMTAGSGSAATIDPIEMISQFSVIALGDYTLTSHTPGSVFVGGNFTAAQSINSGTTNASVGEATGTLIVGGNIVGGGSTTVKGDVAVGGVVTPGTSVNINNGNLSTGISVPVADVTGAMQGLSYRLSQLNETGGETFAGDSNNPRLNLGPTGRDDVSVVNLSSSELAFLFGSNANLGITFSGSPYTTIINVGGSSFDMLSGGNFNDFDGSNNVIFNFFEASTVTLNGPFGASILAPFADVYSGTGGANIFLVGNNVTQRNEIRAPFTGDIPPAAIAPVPLPAAGWMLLAALAGLMGLRRRTRV